MANIAKVTQGALAKNKKLNEIIQKLNPLLNIEVNQVEADDPLEIEYSDNNVVLRVPGASALAQTTRTITICENGSATQITVIVPGS